MLIEIEVSTSGLQGFLRSLLERSAKATGSSTVTLLHLGLLVLLTCQTKTNQASMKLVLFTSLLLVLAVCNSDPLKPKTILASGTFAYDLTYVRDPSMKKVYTYRIDAANQRMRMDFISGSNATIFVSDFRARIEYVLYGNDKTFSCSAKHDITENPFYEDMFAKAKYSGVTIFNGHATTAWPGFEIDGETFTAYMDLFDRTVVGFVNAEIITTVTKLNGTTPDAALFNVPQGIVQCDSKLPKQHLFK